MERFKIEYGTIVGLFGSLAVITTLLQGLLQKLSSHCNRSRERKPQFQKIVWLPLEECVKHHHYFEDGHLRVMIFRAATALKLQGLTG